MSERPGYGDAEAKRIIERAAEIDVEQGRRLDALALREIAAEAGISALAVDKALEEHSLPRPASLSWFKRHRTLLTIVAIVIVLFIYVVARRAVPVP
jgi:hypothetical protein